MDVVLPNRGPASHTDPGSHDFAATTIFCLQCGAPFGSSNGLDLHREITGHSQQSSHSGLSESFGSRPAKASGLSKGSILSTSMSAFPECPSRSHLPRRSTPTAIPSLRILNEAPSPKNRSMKGLSHLLGRACSKSNISRETSPETLPLLMSSPRSAICKRNIDDSDESSEISNPRVRTAGFSGSLSSSIKISDVDIKYILNSNQEAPETQGASTPVIIRALDDLSADNDGASSQQSSSGEAAVVVEDASPPKARRPLMLAVKARRHSYASPVRAPAGGGALKMPASGRAVRKPTPQLLRPPLQACTAHGGAPLHAPPAMGYDSESEGVMCDVCIFRCLSSAAALALHCEVAHVDGGGVGHAPAR